MIVFKIIIQVGSLPNMQVEGMFDSVSHTREKCRFWSQFGAEILKSAPKSLANLSLEARFPATSSNFLRYDIDTF